MQSESQLWRYLRCAYRTIDRAIIECHTYESITVGCGLSQLVGEYLRRFPKQLPPGFSAETAFELYCCTFDYNLSNILMHQPITAPRWELLSPMVWDVLAKISPDYNTYRVLYT